jgi:hypothetical protein
MYQLIDAFGGGIDAPEFFGFIPVFQPQHEQFNIANDDLQIMVDRMGYIVFQMNAGHGKFSITSS